MLIDKLLRGLSSSVDIPLGGGNNAAKGGNPCVQGELTGLKSYPNLKGEKWEIYVAIEDLTTLDKYTHAVTTER